MTESLFTPTNAEADIEQYKNVDLESLNASAEDGPPPTEKKLEQILVQIVFYMKIAVWTSLVVFVIVAFVSWTRNQTQDGILMKLDMNTAGSPLCKWMNRGSDQTLRKDTPFRDYMIANGKKNLLEINDASHCLASDTIATWLDLQKKFQIEQLAKSYEKIIPKKFLFSNITSSPELETIAEYSPEHRIHHDQVIDIISDTMMRVNNSSSIVSCYEIRFSALDAEVFCETVTRSPVQSRTKTLEFLQALSQNSVVLVTYPSTLDMQEDKKNGTLSTKFSTKLRYIPSRYEAEAINNLTYDKR